jgi:hypothetical protein
LSDVVRLTYLRFSMSPRDSLRKQNPITHAFALSAIPFDFPVVSHAHSMQQHRFIYGCTLRQGQFDSALEGAKIDCIVKIDAESLRQRGIKLAEEGELARFAEVDTRSVTDILQAQKAGIEDPCIQVFDLPAGIHGQEPVFVSRQHPVSEDDGYLIFYAYDEAQLLPNGDAPDDSRSQMYIVDARKMASQEPSAAIVGIVDLPARVPYGLHSNYITAEQIDSQLKEQNPAAEIIESALQVDSSKRRRVRSATVQLVDASERMVEDLKKRTSTESQLTLWMWCASMYWVLLRFLGLKTDNRSWVEAKSTPLALPKAHAPHKPTCTAETE